MSKTRSIVRRSVLNLHIEDMTNQLPSRLKDPKIRKLYDAAREYARSKGFEVVLSTTK